MPKRLLLITAFLLTLAACDGLYFATPTPSASLEPTIWVTNTAVAPTDEPTPTQEAPHWSTDCLPPGVFPLNPNPCPVNYETVHWDANSSQEIPEGMALNIELITNGATRVPDIRYVSGAMRLYTYFFAGRAGVQVHGLQLDANHCYTFNMPVRLNFLGASNYDNFSLYSHVYTDRGSDFDLNVHKLIVVEGNTAILTGDNPRIFWAFMPADDMTIVWEVGYEAAWATAGGGNYLDFLAFYVQRQDNTQLCR